MPGHTLLASSPRIDMKNKMIYSSRWEWRSNTLYDRWQWQSINSFFIICTNKEQNHFLLMHAAHVLMDTSIVQFPFLRLHQISQKRLIIEIRTPEQYNPRGALNLPCSRQKSTKQWGYLRIGFVLSRASAEKKWSKINPCVAPKNSVLQPQQFNPRWALNLACSRKNTYNH
jgi:hypothetical protein